MRSRLSLLTAILLFITHPVCLAATRPHILLVMADDQGWGDMAYHGHPLLQTPNFDEAASSGLRFDRFYAAAPVCSPTRASVMTGRHPNRMGVFTWGYPMRPQETTIAEALRSVGYVTAHFGKWHLGSVRHGSPAHPGNNGFHSWLSAPNFYDNDPVLSREGTAVALEGESSMIAVDAALDWLTETSAEDVPMFAVVWFGSPHSPHRAVAEDRAPYADQPEKLQHFYGEISGMDRAFGKLRQGIANLGIRENTILWYCSDNGALPTVGSSGGFRGRKGSVYEGGLLVPAFLEWPAEISQPQTTDLRCSTVDIYPTLLDIVDVTIENQPPLDGASLLPLIQHKPGEGKPQRGIGFWDYPAPGIRTPSAEWMRQLLTAQRAGEELLPHQSSLKAATLPSPAYATDSFPGHAAWVQGDWKLHRIQQKNSDQVRWELYDLGNDPHEKNDLATMHPEHLGKLQGELTAWLQSVVRSLNGDDYREGVVVQP